MLASIACSGGSSLGEGDIVIGAPEILLESSAAAEHESVALGARDLGSLSECRLDSIGNL